MKRSVVYPLLLALLAPVACRRELSTKQRLLGFIEKTENQSREFDYEVEAADQKTQVRGEVEDSLRFHAVMSVDGVDTREQIVDDDTLAVRIIDANRVPELSSPTIAASQIILNALIGGQWVVDPSGAPGLNTKADEISRATDPINDGANIFRYVRLAIQQAQEVKEWREEDLEPAYKASEDHFPKPVINAAERRFDLVRPALPRPSSRPGGIEQEPNASMFRRMAIYVRKGVVVKILEEIDIDGHPDFVDARRDNRKRTLDYLERIKGLKGSREIRQRKMSIVFGNIGKPLQVRQPSEGLRASLEGVFKSSVQQGDVLPGAEQQPEASPTSG